METGRQIGISLVTMNNNLAFYQNNKNALIEQYDSVSFESVHGDWIKFLPNSGKALDIGAGSGRDARYLSKHGFSVYAIEPALSLMLAAQENSADHDINWYQDSLPSLNQIKLVNVQFDLVLLSAVWMHLSPIDRIETMRQLSSLLNAGGRLVITLRHGAFSDARTAYFVSADEVCQLADHNDLSVLLITDLAIDQLGRGDVAWQTLVLEKKT